MKKACIMCLTAVGMTFATALYAADRVQPSVPDGLEVSTDFDLFLIGHATGTQNYVCLPSATGFDWNLFTPEATLFNDPGKQIITHYFSPNPDEGGVIRATWQDSLDTSTVWAKVVPNGASFDARFVAKDAVAWLKLEVVGRAAGPLGSNRLIDTKFIQRLNTAGGAAPKDGCASFNDVGRKAFMPYTADYLFYKKHVQN